MQYLEVKLFCIMFSYVYNYKPNNLNFIGADMTIDDRSFVMQAVATMPISISVVYIYPRLLPLHDIDPQDTELPQMLRCSIDKFSDDGAYLLGKYVIHSHL